MRKSKPVNSPFVEMICSKEWRERLASSMLGKLSGNELLVAPNVYELVARADPWPKLEAYLRERRDIPWSLVEELWRKHAAQTKPPKRGRYAHPEVVARQRANDLACFTAFEALILAGMKRYPAAEHVGKLMNLSYKTVIGAWKREKSRRDRHH